MKYSRILLILVSVFFCLNSAQAQKKIKKKGLILYSYSPMTNVLMLLAMLGINLLTHRRWITLLEPEPILTML